MKLKEGFTLRQICGQYIVVGEGLAQVNFNKMLTLNDSAAYLWQAVQDRDFSIDDLATLLTDKYEVEMDQAAKDAATLVQVWLEQGVAEA